MRGSSLSTVFVLFGLLVSMIGCGVEELPAAELAAVCGQDGAFRVLELDPGVRLTAPPVAHDGRVVVLAGEYGPALASGGAPWPTNIAAWSVGPCGEAPVRLDEVVEVRTAPRWPELLLGHRRAAGEIVTIDPAGTNGGHVVFAGVGPSSLQHWTEHGLVTFAMRGEDIGVALLNRYPEDPASETSTSSVLLADVSLFESEGIVLLDGGATVLTSDALYNLAPEGELRRVALVDGAVTVEQTDVQSFAVSPDERWLVWQRLGEDPNDYQGPVYLRDRTNGSERSLGDMRATSQAFRWFADGLMVIDSAPYINSPEVVYTLEPLDAVGLPTDRRLKRVLADGRWAIGPLFKGNVELFDPEDGSVTPLTSHGTVIGWGDDAAEVLAVQTCCIEKGTSLHDEGRLFRVAYDGGEELIGERATRVGVRLADGRRVTGLGIGDDLLGSLVLIDPATASSSTVDTRVFPTTVTESAAFGEDTIVYSVDDGARSGVYIARLGQEG